MTSDDGGDNVHTREAEGLADYVSVMRGKAPGGRINGARVPKKRKLISLCMDLRCLGTVGTVPDTVPCLMVPLLILLFRGFACYC